MLSFIAHQTYSLWVSYFLRLWFYVIYALVVLVGQIISKKINYQETFGKANIPSIQCMINWKESTLPAGLRTNCRKSNRNESNVLMYSYTRWYRDSDYHSMTNISPLPPGISVVCVCVVLCACVCICVCVCECVCMCVCVCVCNCSSMEDNGMASCWYNRYLKVLCSTCQKNWKCLEEKFAQHWYTVIEQSPHFIILY